MSWTSFRNEACLIYRDDAAAIWHVDEQVYVALGMAGSAKDWLASLLWRRASGLRPGRCRRRSLRSATEWSTTCDVLSKDLMKPHMRSPVWLNHVHRLYRICHRIHGTPDHIRAARLLVLLLAMLFMCQALRVLLV